MHTYILTFLLTYLLHIWIYINVLCMPLIQNLVILKPEYVKHKKYERYGTSNIKLVQGFHIHSHVALIAQCAAGNKNMSHF
jgi:hypothetical protein